MGMEQISPYTEKNWHEEEEDKGKAIEETKNYGRGFRFCMMFFIIVGLITIFSRTMRGVGSLIIIASNIAIYCSVFGSFLKIEKMPQKIKKKILIRGLAGWIAKGLLPVFSIGPIFLVLLNDITPYTAALIMFVSNSLLCLNITYDFMKRP